MWVCECIVGGGKCVSIRVLVCECIVGGGKCVSIRVGV